MRSTSKGRVRCCRG